MQFGIYLVENGVLSCEEFFEALRIHLRSRSPLGALAIQMRKLNFRQVFAILRAQCDSPNDLFGELAVGLGFLTQDDLAQLLAEQTLHSKTFADVLVENSVLSADALEQHYGEFRRYMKYVERAEFAAAATGEVAAQV